MKNFDCTQFITFNTKENDIDKIITNLFNDNELKIICKKSIEKVKKEYFLNYIEESLYEILDKEFLGEFDSWNILENPPEKVKKILNCIEIILEKYNVSDFKIFITEFAEKNDTEDEVFEIKKENMFQEIFKKSPNDYKVWTDNIILKII